MRKARKFLVRMLETMIEGRRQAAQRRVDDYLEALGLSDETRR